MTFILEIKLKEYVFSAKYDCFLATYPSISNPVRMEMIIPMSPLNNWKRRHIRVKIRKNVSYEKGQKCVLCVHKNDLCVHLHPLLGSECVYVCDKLRTEKKKIKVKNCKNRRRNSHPGDLHLKFNFKTYNFSKLWPFFQLLICPFWTPVKIEMSYICVPRAKNLRKHLR